MNRGITVFQTSLASKKMVWASLSSDTSCTKPNWSTTLVMVEQTYSYSLVLVSSCHCERNQQGTALPLNNCSAAHFWFLHVAIPASSLCHEHRDQGVGDGCLLGLILWAAYPWWSLISGLFVLTSSSQMSVNFPCPQSITAGMEGGPGTSFLKSNTTKNPMRATWYPKPVVWYPAVSIRPPCTS